MVELPARLKKNGFVYKLVERNSWKAIYSQHDDGAIVAYEVFRIRKQKANSRLIAGEWFYYKAKELFPRNEDFGKTAWTFTSLAAARQCYNNLSRKEKV